MTRPLYFSLLFPAAALCGLAQTEAPDPATTHTAAVVRVTATHLARALPDVAGSASVIERGSMETTGALTMDQAVSRLAGVDYQSHGLPGSGAKLDFRGLAQHFGSKGALFIQNGRRLNDPFQGNVEVTHMNMWNVDSITLLRGPASYLYGSGAMGGLVALKMRNGLDKEPFGEFKIEGGNLGTFATSVAAGGQFGETDLYAGATYFKTDGYRPYRDVPKVDWEKQDYFVNVGWRPSEWDELRLEGGHYTGRGFDREGDRNVDRWFGQLSWTREWATPRKQSTAFRVHHSHEHSLYHIAPAGGALFFNRAINPMPPHYIHIPLDYTRDYVLRSTGGGVTHQMEANDTVSFAVGADYRYDTARLADYDSRQHAGEYSLGLFGESDIKLTEALTLTLGLRVDKTETFSPSPSPRAALLWRVTPDSEAYASVTRAFRTPGLSDRYINTMSIYYPGTPFAIALPYKGSPHLKPSHLWAYETGFRQRFDSPFDFMRHAELSIALFYNDFSDEFDFLRSMTDEGTMQMNVANSSQAYTVGGEAELRAYFRRGFEFLGHASYVEGRYSKSNADADIKGNRLPNMAPWKLGAGLQWHSGKLWRDASMSHGFFARFTDARFTGSDNETKLSQFSVFDWNSRLQLCDNIGLTFTVANVFNQNYNVYDIISPDGYPAPGRMYMIGLEGKF